MTRHRKGFALLLAILVAGAWGCAAEGGDESMNHEEAERFGEVRSPVVAGTFYPGDPKSLAAMVDGFLDQAGGAKPGGRIVGIVSPHAGYVYSGGVAGHAYGPLRGERYDTVIVVAPSHRHAFRGASVYAGDGYGTPLGVVPVDRGMADALLDRDLGIISDPGAHAGEHSLEVQVPFLQRALGQFEIVPIIMGSQTEGAVRALAGRISAIVAEASDKSVLLVASTDLSHYHDDRTAKTLDSRVADAISDFDPEGLLRRLAAGECEACGGGPTAVVMMAARALGADAARVVAYATSGDVTGDRSQVVGYLAALITAPSAEGSTDDAAGGRARGANPAAAKAPSGEAEASPAGFQGVDAKERKALLSLARSTIEAVAAGREPPSLDLRSRTLDTPCGAFVTLHKSGRLRGCIGYVHAVKPLRDAVRDMAIQAAFHDPRFPAVTADEVPQLDIEISVLSPLEPVLDVSGIVVGRDGLVVRAGGASGLLLPQVATEQGWDRETFLDHTCMKAGLPPGTWRRDGVEILRFTAVVFGESEPASPEAGEGDESR